LKILELEYASEELKKMKRLY